MNAIHTEEYKGCTIEIMPDNDPENPREWDNLGTMVCFHRHYELGDKHNMTVEEARALASRKDVIALPLYLYDHSGVTMNTTGFHCPWDSGQVGFIYVTKESIRKEYSVKHVTKKLIDKIKHYLNCEVETYDKYLTGDVYGFEVTREGEFIESVWGFFGMDDAIEEAKKCVAY
jgi:hypothetical protein